MIKKETASEFLMYKKGEKWLQYLKSDETV